jgi:hypothetical protein
MARLILVVLMAVAVVELYDIANTLNSRLPDARSFHPVNAITQKR